MSAPDAVPPVLGYTSTSIPESFTTVWSERLTPDRHRVLVPPLQSWRLLGRGFLIGIPVLGGYFALMLLSILRERPFEGAAFVLVGLEIGIPLTMLILIASDRIHRRLSFEVTPYAFRKTSTGLLGAHSYAWPRSDVRSLGLNSLTGKLVLQVKGFHTHVFYLTADTATNQYISDELQRALVELPAAASADQLLTDPSDSMRPSRTRSILLGVGVVLVIAAVIGTILFPAGWCMWFIPASIPLGLAFGRQPQKDFWV